MPRYNGLFYNVYQKGSSTCLCFSNHICAAHKNNQIDACGNVQNIRAPSLTRIKS